MGFSNELDNSGDNYSPDRGNSEAYRSDDVRSSTIVLENDSNSCMARALFDKSKDMSNNSNIFPFSIDKKLGDDKVGFYSPDGKITSQTDQEVCKECKRRVYLGSHSSVEMTADGDWQANLITPLQRLSHLFKLGHLTDITIMFYESDVVYKAHRLLLAMASPVFEKMFYGSNVEAVTGKVMMHCSPAPIKWVLDNLYLGKTELPNVITAIVVYDVAQMYQMTSVAALCRDYLKYEVSMSNVSDIFEVALTHTEDVLMRACLKKLCSSWPEMLQEHIADLTLEIWKYMLKKEVLPTPEVELFKGLVKWGQCQLESADKPSSPEAIREVIDKLLPNLRLLSIPSDKFIDHVMPTKIFTAEECSSILMKLRGVPTCLPRSVRCSSVPYSRIDTTEATLRFVVVSRISDCRKPLPTLVMDICLIKNLSVSGPILLYQIQTQDNSTLKYAQMIVSDGEGVQVGVARALGAQWRFVVPVFLYANKIYNVTIDKVLVSKAFMRKEFCTYSTDIRFKGSTGDNFLKLSFWPAQIKSI